MSLKPLHIVLLVFLLSGLLYAGFVPVKVDAAIYITSGGAINPPSAHIITTDNVTYRFTGNVNDSIIIQRDNIVLDGTGYSLVGKRTGTAISLTYGSNVTIKNVLVLNFSTGVYLRDSSYCRIQSCLVANNSWHGIWFDTVSHSIVSENNITGNTNRAIMIDYSSHNTIRNNTIDEGYKGLEITYYSEYNNVTGNTISGHTDAGIIIDDYSCYNRICGNNITGNFGTALSIAVYSANNTISENTMADNSNAALIIVQSPNCTVTDNHMTGNFWGISIRYVNGTLLRGNTMLNNTYNFALDFYSVNDFANDVDKSNTVNGRPIYYWANKHGVTVPEDAGLTILFNCTDVTAQHLNMSQGVWHGIIVAYSSNVTVAECWMKISEYGVWLWNATDCHVEGNHLECFMGLQLHHSTANAIYNNTITGGGNMGAVSVTQSSGNTFYRNRFIDNYGDVLSDELSTNNWDNGYQDGGNYWDRYEDRISGETDIYGGPGQDEPTGPDGYWDDPYPVVAYEEYDNYPLVPEYSSMLGPIFCAITALSVILVPAMRKTGTRCPV